ncbi:hypothetical protein [Sulfurovum sp.]|uniref:hypothetical protein n=1 Tax=Sulfurovum sp. TaxID=1969726 RepID=UPI002867D4FA|nr:hypothetical protein [Sulfurovum sp.]
MQKIWIISAMMATLTYAQEINIEEELESQKTNPAVTQSSYMPDISLILDAGYTNESLDIDTDHVAIPSFIDGHGGHDEHAHYPLVGNDGFNLNYAELALESSVDNYFDLKVVFHITEDFFETEEAYAVTNSLPYHLKAKIGKFFSDFGYINKIHEHAYNFVEIPLIYEVLLGGHGLVSEGVQLQYVLPTKTYIMAGVEFSQGNNEQSFGIDGFTPPGAVEDFAGVEEVSQPSLTIAYLKTSFDISGGTVLAGLSIAQGDSRINHLEDEESPHAFAGDTTIYGADLVYKKYLSAQRAIAWQSEYLYREMDGTQYIPEEGTWGNTLSLHKEQGGYYTELVYQHDRNIKAGARYSIINQNDVMINDSLQETPDDMSITSAMAEYNFSEYSRLRLQYNYNTSLYTEEGLPNNKEEVILQFTYAIGAHGAHAF